MRFKVLNEVLSKEEKTQRIEKELARQIGIYRYLDARIQAKLYPYLKELAFITTMLDEKRAIMIANGTIEKKQTAKGIWSETVSATQESYQKLLSSYSEIQSEIEQLIK